MSYCTSVQDKKYFQCRWLINVKINYSKTNQWIFFFKYNLGENQVRRTFFHKNMSLIHTNRWLTAIIIQTSVCHLFQVLFSIDSRNVLSPFGAKSFLESMLTFVFLCYKICAAVLGEFLYKCSSLQIISIAGTVPTNVLLDVHYEFLVILTINKISEINF